MSISEFGTIWHDANPGYRIALKHDEPFKYAVVYGRMVFDGLTYSQATRKLGECIMHKTTCHNYVPPE